MIKSGRFGPYGGTYVPEILVPALEGIEKAFLEARKDKKFNQKLKELLSTFAGRPTSLYRCQNLFADKGVKLYLKREDLVHGGAHKTNQVVGQALLAKRMGKKRIIAETGAGQHGVAVAMVGALLGIKVVVYMGQKDVERQKPNVFRMQLFGAEVKAVTSGGQTLKDAINEALRDWSASYESSHYLLGTVAGPHPFPFMVREFQRVIGKEAKKQIQKVEGKLPDHIVAAVGGGSNAMGVFFDFIDHKQVKLHGVEPAGKGLNTKLHGSTLQKGTLGVLHGAYTKILQDKQGQVLETHSLSAGLDYPAVGPEHVYLQSINRVNYVGITDDEALQAFKTLSQQEGIIPALESAHAVAYGLKLAEKASRGQIILVNISGRGDKDMPLTMKLLEKQLPKVKQV